MRRMRHLTTVWFALYAAACSSSEVPQSPAAATGVVSVGGQDSGVETGQSGDPGDSDDPGGDDSTGGPSEPENDSGADSDTDSGEPKLDVADPREPVDPTGGVCAGVTQSATIELRPSDIIVVVDNSSSMDAEADAVQNNLNAFSQQISDAGVDARVVLISSYPGEGTEGMCIEPPLGGGGCPDADANPPEFTHVPQDVGSNSLLYHTLDYHSDYDAVLRPGSLKHVVAVTDDCSELPVEDFHASWTAFGADYEDYRFHAVVDQEGCGECGGGGYVWLSETTGGLVSNVCADDYGAIFDALSVAVVEATPLECSWPLPPPPAGEVFDPDEVNVYFDDGAGMPLLFGYVESLDQCAAVAHGWLYDDPVAPTSIQVCPQTCDLLQGAPRATIDIELGCATIPAS